MIITINDILSLPKERQLKYLQMSMPDPVSGMLVHLAPKEMDLDSGIVFRNFDKLKIDVKATARYYGYMSSFHTKLSRALYMGDPEPLHFEPLESIPNFAYWILNVADYYGIPFVETEVQHLPYGVEEYSQDAAATARYYRKLFRSYTDVYEGLMKYGGDTGKQCLMANNTGDAIIYDLIRIKKFELPKYQLNREKRKNILKKEQRALTKPVEHAKTDEEIERILLGLD